MSLGKIFSPRQYVLEVDDRALALKVYSRANLLADGLTHTCEVLREKEAQAEDWPDFSESAPAPGVPVRTALFFKQFFRPLTNKQVRVKKIYLSLPGSAGSWRELKLPAASRQEIDQALNWELGEEKQNQRMNYRVLEEDCRDGLSQTKVLVGFFPEIQAQFWRGFLKSYGLDLGGVYLRWPKDVPGQGNCPPWKDALPVKNFFRKKGFFPLPVALSRLWPAGVSLLILLAGCFLQPNNNKINKTENIIPSGGTYAADASDHLPVLPIGAEAAEVSSPSSQAASAQVLYQYPQPPGEPAVKNNASGTGSQLAAQPEIAEISLETLRKNYQLSGVIQGKASWAVFRGPGGSFSVRLRQQLAEGWQLKKIVPDGVWLISTSGQKIFFIL